MPVLACLTCDPTLQELVFNGDFFPTLLAMGAPFVLVGVVVRRLHGLP